MNLQTIPLARISGHDPITRNADFPGSTQIRAANDPELAAKYAQLIADGAVFPAIIVVDDGSGMYLLSDGHHRVEARWIVHALDPERYSPTIEAEVHEGTFADAIRLAIEANRAHGQPLSERDLRHAYNRAVSLNVLVAHDVNATRELLGCSIRSASRFTEYAREQFKLERDALILALSEAGQTQRSIARTVGVTQQTVSYVLAYQKRPMAEISKDDEQDEPELDIVPPSPIPSKDAAAERWRAEIAASRQAAAAVLKAPFDAADPGTIEGVYPLPDAPPVPFKRPAAREDTFDLVSQALELVDQLPDAVEVRRWLTEIDDGVEARVARSLEWLNDLRNVLTEKGNPDESATKKRETNRR